VTRPPGGVSRTRTRTRTGTACHAAVARGEVVLYNRAMPKLPLILLSLSLIGCGDNAKGKPDGSMPGDAEVDAPPNPFTTLATFDPALGELPEGVITLNGVVYVGLAPLGKIVKIATPGTVEMFGSLPAPVTSTYTLGLAANAAGDIFVGVGVAGTGFMPPPGVYRIPAAGGTAAVFATSAAMTFPNGIDVVGNKLYVTDSSVGKIFEINQAGAVTTWLSDPMLVGNMSACGGTGAPFVIGANGIVHDATNRYVAVTDYGRIVKIPVMANGMAGTPTVLAESCEKLQGVDGIALEAAGTIVAVRNGPSRTMSRISADGQTVTPIHMGPPLDGPASVTIMAGTTPQLVITNSAFFSGAMGKPSVLALKL
jgi:hypothetical protein